MLGYDISWAGFNVVEVMASTKFTEKRVGYLAASQCFHKVQCGKLEIFLSLRFYVKSILESPEVQNLLF